MTYLKATVVGIVAAIIFGAGWTWAALQLPIWWQMWQQRNQGAGVGASSVGSGSVLLAALIGFVLGFSWTMRRVSN
jgi:ABC-type phosphate transport system permease subunit